jgi:methionyl-tRNA formyltransferase
VFVVSPPTTDNMRIAIIGQSQFAGNVFKELLSLGHQICGVFTIEDKQGREDALAVLAKQNAVPVFKVKLIFVMNANRHTTNQRNHVVLFSV